MPTAAVMAVQVIAVMVVLAANKPIVPVQVATGGDVDRLGHD